MLNDSIPSQALSRLSRPFDLEEKLIAAINEVADSKFIPYLGEAWQCFNSRAYNAAILCTWSAISAYIKEVVRNIPLGEELFSFRYKNPTSKQSPVENSNDDEEDDLQESITVSDDGKNIDLKHIGDRKLIETCKEIGILYLREDGPVYDWITKAREHRNNLAHDPWDSESPPQIEMEKREEAVKYVQNAIKIFLTTPVTENVSVDTTTILAFVRWKERIIPPEQIDALINRSIDRGALLEFCNRIYNIYRSTRGKTSSENAKQFVNLIYRKLDNQNKENFAFRCVKDMANAVGLIAELQDGQWIFSQRYITDKLATAASENNEAKKPVKPSEQDFDTLLDLEVWKDIGLSIQHRDGFYKAIIHFLDWEIEKKQDTGQTTDLSTRKLEEFVIYAPVSYSSIVTERKTELQGGSHAKPST